MKRLVMMVISGPHGLQPLPSSLYSFTLLFLGRFFIEAPLFYLTEQPVSLDLTFQYLKRLFNIVSRDFYFQWFYTSIPINNLIDLPLSP